jgi:hypothetical protein
MKAFIIALALILFCCYEKKESSKDLSQLKARYFKEAFIKKFKKLELPCSIEHQPHAEYSLGSFDPTSLDTLILGGSGFGVAFYGMLSNPSFHTMIMYAPAAQSIPVLMTFDPEGNRISGASIDFGCWSGGPYDYTCSGGFIIHQDMTVSLNHETIVTKSYDDRDSTEIFPAKYSNSWKGKILNNGIIEIEKHPE